MKELIFIIGLIGALWFVHAMYPRKVKSYRSRCPGYGLKAADVPGSIYNPISYPKDTATSDLKNRVIDPRSGERLM